MLRMTGLESRAGFSSGIKRINKEGRGWIREASQQPVSPLPPKNVAQRLIER
jgi:hypothetical protein